MTKRVPGIDIIKILAIFLVPSLHFFLNYGFIEQPYIGAGKITQETVRWISFSCIGLFLMATGYLQCNKKPNPEYFRKVIKYVIPLLIYSILTALIMDGTHEFIKKTLYYLLQFPTYMWYMGFFLGFYLLIPYFGMIVNGITTKRNFQLLILILIIVTSIPEFINSIPAMFGDWKYVYLPNWWREFFPVTYFFLGTYFRKFKPKISKKIALSLLIIVAALISLVDYYFSFANAQDRIPTFVGGGYGSIVTVTITVLIFLLLYDIDIKQTVLNRVTKYVSGITLEIYLGYMFTGKFVTMFIESNFPEFRMHYNAFLYFVAVPLDFILSLCFAVVVTTIVLVIQKGFSIVLLIIDRRKSETIF